MNVDIQPFVSILILYRYSRILFALAKFMIIAENI